MTSQDKAFEERLLATFLIEAEEHIHAISLGLTELEKGLAGEDLHVLIETMFRDAHSLKGAARSIGQKEVESLCHPMESVFSALKRHQIELQPGIIDLLHDSVSVLSLILSSPHSLPASVDRNKIRYLINKLGEASRGQFEIITENKETIEKIDPKPQHEEVKQIAGSIRIQVKRLDPLLLQAEELILSKNAFSQRISDFNHIGEELQTLRAEFPKLKSSRAADHLQKDVEIIHWIDGRLNTLEHLIDTLKHKMEHDHHDLTRNVDDHLDGMKQLLLMPVLSLAEGFPKIIRDLARDQRKEVGLVMQGTDLEIDRRILDELKDPLIHLLRNSVDHAIESPQARLAANKPSQGTITLSFILRENHQVEIRISDDGKGIDHDKVLATAIRTGLVDRERAESLTPEAIASFIFYSGLSTAEVITDLSGRGLGLAIVREKVEKSGGSLSVETRKGEGTLFRIVMPLTFTTFRGVLIRSAGQSFMIPTTNVERVTRIPQAQIVTVENKKVIIYDGQHVSAVSLADILDLPVTARKTTKHDGFEENNKENQFAIINFSNQRIAFQIDEVLSEHQFLLKSLGKQLRKVKNISGATVLGTGQLVPVLNVADLMISAIKPTAARSLPDSAIRAERKEKHILIAEDSITSRMLLKNILEASGYLVTTAVDGMDAYTQAREREFDLMISDVDMPRMNGFELCRKVRANKKLAELPIILITSLSTREDREQGIDAGANAYIVKSNFEQSNLLEVIRKLI
jgi:two-component system chemotaxis sensor kinase CheA